jgi:hypothetical protein
MDRACRAHWKRGMHIEYWWENQKVRGHCETQDVVMWIILKWILESWDGAVWNKVI